MPKVYSIIRDNGHVLVGTGGNVGDPPRVRTGLHLPGGTYGQNESAINGALREVREETGIELLAQDVVNSFTLLLNGIQVGFLVFEVFSVASEINTRVVPQGNNPEDQPFADLSSIPLAECYKNSGFGAHHRTDWFAYGLTYANNNRML